MQEEEAMFADIFHQPADEHDDDDNNGAKEEGFDETVTKKQAFHFWGVDK